MRSSEKRISGYVQKAADRRETTENQAQAMLADINYSLDYGQIKG